MSRSDPDRAAALLLTLCTLISLTLKSASDSGVKITHSSAEIKVQSVKGARLLDPDLTGSFKIAYVRLIQFNEPTADELSKALDELQRQEWRR